MYHLGFHLKICLKINTSYSPPRIPNTYLFNTLRCLAPEAHLLRGNALCAWSLSRAIHIMDCNEIILPPTDATEIHDCLIEHLLHWQGLSQHYMSLGVYRWKLRPKHHDLEEVAKFCKRTRVNPRCTACWQDESYLGQVKHVAVKCHSTTALLRIFQRIILRLAQKWHDSKKHA